MPPALALQLINTPAVEVIPADLHSARRSIDARQLALADWLIRRKSDGRYLATLAEEQGEIHWLMCLPGAGRQIESLIDTGLTAMGLRRNRPLRVGYPVEVIPTLARSVRQTATLPLTEVARILRELGIAVDYGKQRGLARIPEPCRLAYGGRDRFGRPLWLYRPAALAWQRLRKAARADGLAIEAISGYRSHLYQAGIFRRKLARGLSLVGILAVNAAPGYSEHHSGCALDIGAMGEPPAEESFEHTAAFVWLKNRAAEFGFRLSYPRDNPHGIAYEPWHWCWQPAQRGLSRSFSL